MLKNTFTKKIVANQNDLSNYEFLGSIRLSLSINLKSTPHIFGLLYIIGPYIKSKNAIMLKLLTSVFSIKFLDNELFRQVPYMM